MNYYIYKTLLKTITNKEFKKMEKIKNTKTFLETSIIRLQQLDKQKKDISKQIIQIKKDILANKYLKNSSHYFSDELHTYSLQIIYKTSKTLDIEEMKKAEIYEKYKTKDKNSTTFHINKYKNEVVKKVLKGDI